MRVAVLGTGMVGRAHAARLAEVGHDPVLGTRDPQAWRAREGDGEQPAAWLAAHPSVEVATFAEAVVGAELVVTALDGRAVVPVVTELADALAGVVVLDVTNPLDFSSGELSLFVVDTDSLGESVQRAAPAARVVKALSTVTAPVQVDPASLGSEHDAFVAGDDDTAKELVVGLLREYGWTTVHDLGPLSGARGMEMVLPLWLRLMQRLGTPEFGWRVVLREPASTDPTRPAGA